MIVEVERWFTWSDPPAPSAKDTILGYFASHPPGGHLAAYGAGVLGTCGARRSRQDALDGAGTPLAVLSRRSQGVSPLQVTIWLVSARVSSGCPRK